MSCAWVFVLWLSVPHFVPSSRVFLLSLLLLLELPPCGRHRGNKPLALRQLRSLAPWPKTPLSQVMSPTSSTTPLLRDYWNLRPGAIQRRVALLLVWRGTRRRDHRQSALFTTVHSGARRTSEPWTSLALFWRKFVASSVLFCVSFKNGETRAWTLFAKFTQQRKTKSRLRKWANQDSPWTTKRANSRWF